MTTVEQVDQFELELLNRGYVIEVDAEGITYLFRPDLPWHFYVAPNDVGVPIFHLQFDEAPEWLGALTEACIHSVDPDCLIAISDLVPPRPGSE